MGFIPMSEKYRNAEIISRQVERIQNLSKYIARGYAFDTRATIPDRDEVELENMGYKEFLDRLGLLNNPH